MPKPIMQRPSKPIVKNLRFAIHNNEPRKLGGNMFGKVFVGRLKLKDGKRPRVAIKRFINSLSHDEAKRYQQTIVDLHNAGVRIPKMGMVLLPPGTQIGNEVLKYSEWVQVSQLFGSTEKGSKLVGKSHFKITDPKAKVEALIELTKVANAGYYPAEDIVEPFRVQAKGVIPFDIDMLAIEGKTDVMTRAEKIVDIINDLFPHSERAYAFEIANETAIPELRQALWHEWRTVTREQQEQRTRERQNRMRQS